MIIMEYEQDSLKLPRHVVNIPGTKPNVLNGQLLVSSGIPSLDELLGGGIPVGTVLLLEEDQYGIYTKVILKYFLAEGVVSNQSTFIASQDTPSKNLMQELPAVAVSDPESRQSNNNTSADKMKIAFMYENVPTSEKQRPLDFGNFYDLGRSMPKDHIEKSDIFHWIKGIDTDASDVFLNPSYHHLLQSISDKLKQGEFSLKAKPKERSILRIGLHSLGSLMWHENDTSTLTIKQNPDLGKFLFYLRALVRSSFAVAFVTVQSHLIEKDTVERCIYSSDIAVRLQAFAGTELENNPVLSDYQGYFHVIKLAAINSFVSKHPGSVEYTFKLRRRKFHIEKLHLPPALDDTTDKPEKRPSLGCGSSDKHLLEF